jgi:hypothetical protein
MVTAALIETDDGGEKCREVGGATDVWLKVNGAGTAAVRNALTEPSTSLCETPCELWCRRPTVEQTRCGCNCGCTRQTRLTFQAFSVVLYAQDCSDKDEPQDTRRNGADT